MGDCNSLQSEMPFGSNGPHAFLLQLASLRSRALEDLNISSKFPGGLGLGRGDFDTKDQGQSTWAIGNSFLEHPEFFSAVLKNWSHREITWIKALLSVYWTNPPLLDEIRKMQVAQQAKENAKR